MSNPTGATVHTIEMHVDKQCKGSVRYAADNDKAPLQSVYLSRTAYIQMPSQVVVTVAQKGQVTT